MSMTHFGLRNLLRANCLRHSWFGSRSLHAPARVRSSFHEAQGLRRAGDNEYLTSLWLWALGSSFFYPALSRASPSYCSCETAPASLIDPKLASILSLSPPSPQDSNRAQSLRVPFPTCKQRIIMSSIKNQKRQRAGVWTTGSNTVDQK